jgi:hypothetical protein
MQSPARDIKNHLPSDLGNMSARVTQNKSKLGQEKFGTRGPVRRNSFNMTEPDRHQFRKSGPNFQRQVTSNTTPSNFSSVTGQSHTKNRVLDLTQGNFVGNNSDFVRYCQNPEDQNGFLP